MSAFTKGLVVDMTTKVLSGLFLFTRRFRGPEHGLDHSVAQVVLQAEVQLQLDAVVKGALQVVHHNVELVDQFHLEAPYLTGSS